MALENPAVTGAFALDVQRMDGLRSQAARDPQGALRTAAQQFEAVFISMLLKHMREASPSDGLLESDQGRLYQSMLDQQMAQTMAARGIGLADVIVRQLERVTAEGGGIAGHAAMTATQPPSTAREKGVSAPAPAAGSGPVSGPAPTAAPAASSTGHTRDFVNRVWPHAVAAGRETGISPRFLVAQAALETGWGRHELRHGDGSPAHNLFNIKAGGRWNAAVVDAATIEYVNGAPERSVERFRAYGSYAESFRDYVSLLKNNPRYAEVLSNGHDAAGFARELQKAGYATDPRYADKLMRIMSSVTLRDSLAA